ncbi:MULTISPECIES: hypothetical protein [Xanthomonas]|uniref:hypothetical protein n=1 Tax=Xanthomonas TaxID=338 RepID=UPI0018E379D8|nr:MULTISPECIES: hypothetical protein [Xanthomonas]
MSHDKASPARQLSVSLAEKYTPAGATEEKTYWTDVGRAFAHRDGAGWNITLRAGLAVMGTVLLREPRRDAAAEPLVRPENMPAFLEVCVVDSYTAGDGTEHTHWTDVGRAFPHKDGGGFNVVLRQNLAVHGKLVLREPRTEEQRPFR